MKAFMSSGEVASLFGVDPNTVRRWAAQGRIQGQRTVGGHMRYDRAEVMRLAAEVRGRRG